MATELARVAFGLPVAALLPLGLPWIRTRPLAAAATAVAYSSLVVFPVLCNWRGVLMIAVAAALAALLTFIVAHVSNGDDASLGTAPSSDVDSDTGRVTAAALPIAQLLAASGLAAIAALVADSRAFGDWLSSAVEDSSVSLVISGGLAAVFVGGALVSQLLRPFTADLDQTKADLRTIAHAGTYIGWCERALFYAFIVAGEPDAAAVALAAKSFARFPSLTRQEEGFAEYFLIGTLTSLLVAMAAAVATRALLQHAPL
jgi:hypothetical protein